MIDSSFVPTIENVQLRQSSSIVFMNDTTRDNIKRSINNCKGVIFDIDGTLANSKQLGFDATAKVLKKNNIPSITEAIYDEGTRYSTPERLARHAGLKSSDGENFNSVGNRLASEFDNLYIGLVTIETAGFFSGINGMLKNIPSDVCVGALTNACVRYAEVVLKINSSVPNNNNNDITDSNNALFNRFKSIRGADNVRTPKPSPDGLFQVCEDLHLSPNECVYIGDSPTDAEAANAAGMKAIGVLWGSHDEETLRNAPFVCLCRTVDDLKSILPQS